MHGVRPPDGCDAGTPSGALRGLALVAIAGLASGCVVTTAEFRKLESQVIDMQRAQSDSTARGEYADVASDIDALEGQLRTLSGRIEELERTSNDALAEARRARQDLAQLQMQIGTGAGTVGAGAVVTVGEGAESADAPLTAELAAYRAAYAARRAGDYDECIDQFGKFLQTYASSSYAAAAEYWRADCHFQLGDFKTAVLRFDDVVRKYPKEDKAPDALYRHAESLIKLGPGYREAAKKAYRRVIGEYPDSPRAAQAGEQLEILGS